MRISFMPQAWDDYQHWLRTDKKLLTPSSDRPSWRAR